MRRRGVTIETEIEYRNGPYFVLAVNVKTIDWLKLIKFTSKEVAERKYRWKEQQKRRIEVKDLVEGATSRNAANEGALRCLVKLVYGEVSGKHIHLSETRDFQQRFLTLWKKKAWKWKSRCERLLTKLHSCCLPFEN